MRYIKREAEQALTRLMAQFKVVLVTGARQVGKSTMIRHVLGDTHSYVSLDSMTERISARSDPKAFIEDHPAPVIIDEVQKAPELLDEIKAVVDEDEETGRYVLTGSQTYGLTRGARESLAGRVGILRMSGLSVRELSGSDRVGPHVPGDPWRRSAGARPDPWQAIWRGSAPALADISLDWELHYANYVDTYIQRDVREVLDVRSEERFFRLLRLCASRTGQLVNYADLSRDAGVDDKTAKSWVSVLMGAGIVTLVDSMAPSESSGLARAPKLYLMDTGLACYLLGLDGPDAARRGNASGALFETLAVTELIKSFLNSGLPAGHVRYFRERSGRRREIDAVVRSGSFLYPIEVKETAHPGQADAANLWAVDGIGGLPVAAGEVICATEEPYSVARNVRALSVWDI